LCFSVRNRASIRGQPHIKMFKLSSSCETLSFTSSRDMDMMSEPVEYGAGEPFRTEYGSPFIEWQVAGDQRGAAFIALTEHLEEQFRADRRERHIAQLIDNQQLDHAEV